MSHLHVVGFSVECSDVFENSEFKVFSSALARGGIVKGLAVEELSELEGSFNTLETGFEGNGRMVARTATGGSGYSVDVGSSFEINRDYIIGLNIRNIASSITWDGSPEEYGYLFLFPAMAATCKHLFMPFFSCVFSSIMS